jgi:hypothetical protein
LVTVDGIAVSVIFVGLAIAVELLGEVGDPAGDCLLCLLEALLNVLADLGEVVCAELVSQSWKKQYDRNEVAIPSKKLYSRSGSLGL